MANKRLELAVIGLGAAGRYHCEAAAQVPEIHLAAVVESDLAVGRKIGEQYGAAVFASCRDLLRSGLCQAATIATPHLSHAPLAVECLRAGVHVLTEKPMAATVGEAQKMLAAARRSGAKLGVIFQHRMAPANAKAIELVRAGAIGKLIRATMIYNDFRTQAYYESNVWRGTWKGEGGGVLLNQAPHLLDVLVQLTGLPRRLRGAIATSLHEIEVEDRAQATLSYAGGGVGYVYCTTNEPACDTFIEVVGDKGKLILRGDGLEYCTFGRGLAHFSATNRNMWILPPVRKEKLSPRPFKVGHPAVMRNFARHILRGEKLLCPGAEGLASLELANAIVLSHFEGREVSLPISRRAYAELLADLQRRSRFSKRRLRLQFQTDPRMR